MSKIRKIEKVSFVFVVDPNVAKRGHIVIDIDETTYPKIETVYFHNEKQRQKHEEMRQAMKDFDEVEFY